MKLKALVGNVPGKIRIIGNEETEILSLCSDSRQAKPGALFFCTPGLRMDAHDFAPQAVERKEDPALEGARFSGPADVDGDNGNSVLRKEARAQARTAVQGGPAAVNNGAKVTTYRKSESDDPYVNVGRNEPCPCGSGKKFKYCHGRNR